MEYKQNWTLTNHKKPYNVTDNYLDFFIWNDIKRNPNQVLSPLLVSSCVILPSIQNVQTFAPQTLEEMLL